MPTKGKGLQARLTQKVGPAPVWAWAVAAILGYYLWSRWRGNTATGSALTPQGQSQVADPGSGGAGGPAANFSQDQLDMLSSQLDDLTTALLLSDTSGFADPFFTGASAPGAVTPGMSSNGPALTASTNDGGTTTFLPQPVLVASSPSYIGQPHAQPSGGGYPNIGVPVSAPSAPAYSPQPTYSPTFTPIAGPAFLTPLAPAAQSQAVRAIKTATPVGFVGRNIGALKPVLLPD